MAETLGDTSNLGTASAESAREGRSDGDVLTARDKFRQVTQDVRRGAERVTDEVRRSAEVARERYDAAAENVRLGYDRVRTQVGDVSGQVNTYVRENPGKSVLIAAAAGFLLGLAMRRSRSSGETD